MLEVHGVIRNKAMKDEEVRRRGYGKTFPLLGFNNYYVVYTSTISFLNTIILPVVFKIFYKNKKPARTMSFKMCGLLLPSHT